MQKITLNDNSTIDVINAKKENYTLYINYNGTRQAWFVDVVGESFKINGIKITNSSNILNQWSDKLGFGLGVICENNLDPYFQEDFITNRANLFLLEPDDLILQKTIKESIIYE